MKSKVVTRLEGLVRLLLPNKVLPSSLFRLWVGVYLVYAVLLLYSTGARLLDVLLSSRIELPLKIAALMLAPPVVVVFGLGLGAMLLTVALLVWNDIWEQWQRQMRGNGPQS
jgi:hypothetical protein